MSSSDEDDAHQSTVNDGVSHGVNGAKRKKRKIMRACDFCRRKKIKCDASSKNVGDKCTSCIVHSRDCTFVEGAKKRGPPKGYLEFLENRLDQLEDVLQKLVPSFNVNEEFGPRYTPTSWVETDQHTKPIHTRTSRDSAKVKSKRPSPPSLVLPASDSLHIISPIAHTRVIAFCSAESSSPANVQTPSGLDDILNSSDDEGCYPPQVLSMLPVEDKVEDDLSERFSQLGLQKGPFFGKSSGVRLLERTRTMMSELTGRTLVSLDTISPDRRAEFWEEKDLWQSLSTRADGYAKTLLFPPEDLMNSLIALYFRHFHPTFPTLHLPTLEDQMKRNLHKRDLSFGLQALLVCAVGSRWSEDPRVCVGWDPTVPSDVKVDWHMAGWPFFGQIFGVPHPYRQSARLHDLQNTVLLSFYMQTTQAPHSMWLVVGVGVRMAMDLGAHRRKAYRNDGSLEDELWKRTFWCLVNVDRMTSIILGRPSAINDEDIDVEFPLEVDDASWDETAKQWRQPSDQISLIQGFNCLSRLLQITSLAVRTIYSSKKSKIHLGFVGGEWERYAVSELDSSLNNWIDNLPSHLRWDPNIADPKVFEQSVVLNLFYRQAQIIIHRPFLPGLSKKDSPLAFTSLAICSNAARSVSNILDAHHKRKIASTGSTDPLEGAKTAMPTAVGVAFLAGVVLLMAVWDTKRSGTNVDVTSLVDDAQKITNYIKFAEARLSHAGKLWDTFQELIAYGDSSEAPRKDPPIGRSSQKRRQADDQAAPQQGTIPSKEHSFPTAASTIPSLYNTTATPSISSWAQPHVYGIPIWTNPNSFVSRGHPTAADLHPLAQTQVTNGTHSSSPSNPPQIQLSQAAWFGSSNLNEKIGTGPNISAHPVPDVTPSSILPSFGLALDYAAQWNRQVNLPPGSFANYDNLTPAAPAGESTYPASLQNGISSTGDSTWQPSLEVADHNHSMNPVFSTSQSASPVHPDMGSGGLPHLQFQNLAPTSSLASHSSIITASNPPEVRNELQNADIWMNPTGYDFTAWLDDDWNPFSILSAGEEAQGHSIP